jgi:Type VI secretion system VasI, EvfG, VC_A0118
MDLKKIGIVVAALLIALWILGRVLTGPSRSNTTSGAASPDQATAQDKWQVKEDRSPMDDSKTVMLILDSDDLVHGPLESRKPSLIVRCKEGKTDVYVMTGMPTKIEEDFDGGPSENHTVRTRFDAGEPAIDHFWRESTDHKALFVLDGVDYARQLAAVGTFTFEFTPFDGSPQVARFDLRGLNTHLGQIASACKWSVN